VKKASICLKVYFPVNSTTKSKKNKSKRTTLLPENTFTALNTLIGILFYGFVVVCGKCEIIYYYAVT
jgi:hypothetical protein